MCVCVWDACLYCDCVYACKLHLNIFHKIKYGAIVFSTFLLPLWFQHCNFTWALYLKNTRIWEYSYRKMKAGGNATLRLPRLLGQSESARGWIKSVFELRIMWSCVFDFMLNGLDSVCQEWKKNGKETTAKKEGPRETIARHSMCNVFHTDWEGNKPGTHRQNIENRPPFIH